MSLNYSVLNQSNNVISYKNASLLLGYYSVVVGIKSISVAISSVCWWGNGQDYLLAEGYHRAIEPKCADVPIHRSGNDQWEKDTK